MSTLGPITLFRRIYGSNPIHLLILLACFALTVYVVGFVIDDAKFHLMLVWFLASVAVHDLVLLPIYGTLDRLLSTVVASSQRVPLINHIRVPMLASGLLLLVFFPGILQQGADTYFAATGQQQDPFLERWIALSAAFVASSALVYAFRFARVRFRRRDESEQGEPAPNKPA